MTEHEIAGLVEDSFARSLEPPTAEEVAKNLRDWANVLTIPSGEFVNNDLRYAADTLTAQAARLTELERAWDHENEARGHNHTRAIVAEARIAALVKALKACEPFVAHFKGAWSNQTHGLVSTDELLDTIRAALTPEPHP